MINTGSGSKISCKWLVGGTYIPHHFQVHFKLISRARETNWCANGSE